MTTTTEISPPVEETLAFRELGKFLSLSGAALASGSDPRLPMFSPAVDAAWHELTANTAAHENFCQEHAGQSLRHVPAVGTGPIEWISAYEEAYGRLPEIWFTNEAGVLDEVARSVYLETGQVVTNWDCYPVPADGEPEEGLEAPASGHGVEDDAHERPAA